MDKEEKHESYGVAHISRCQGSSRNFFGSAMRPNHFICLTISKAKKIIDSITGEERPFPEKEIISVRMTSVQFAELITNMNCGSGTPVTIEHINHERIEEPTTQTSAIEQAITGSHLIDCENFVNDQVDELIAIVKNKGSAKEKERARHLEDSIKNRIANSAKFHRKQITDAGEKVVAQAKTEIEAAIIGTAYRLGIEQMKKVDLQLEHRHD